MNKPRGRPFQPNNKFGRGRPKGSRNKANPLWQNMLEEYSEHLMRKCIALALQGDRSAMRLCMERISPARHDAHIRLLLPPVRNAKDVESAAEKVLKAIGRGRITPAEGDTMIGLLESQSRIIERLDLENRLEKLEEAAKGKQQSGTQGT